MKPSFVLMLATGLFLLCGSVFPQETLTSKSKKAVEAYKNAYRYYSQRNFTAAEEQLLAAIEADPKFIEAYLVLGEVYEDAGKPEKAIDIYRRGLPVNERFYPYGYIRLGDLEYKEAQYEKALSSYNHYLSLNTNNGTHIEKAMDGAARCEFSIDAVSHPVDFKPERLGSSVNSDLDEYWPSLSTDEKTLVITRMMPAEGLSGNIQEDFYISTWTGTDWDIMKNAGPPLNTDNNEGAQTISGDGRTMVFTACNRSDGIGRCDLYSAKKEGDRWTTPVNLGKPVNTAHRETQPSITTDGRTLYFSSDRPDGKGKHDIWESHRDESGQWSVPENLGITVNSKGEEMSPFIHPDNQSLYFSSAGLIGLGGYDLFVTRKDSAGHWQTPVNLGYPINTNLDEIGLIVNSRGNKAYYSSDIHVSTGKDIFVFDLPVQSRPMTVTYMKGKVFDANDHKLLRAQFELVDLETGKTINSSYSDSVTGEFLVSIPANRNYLLNVSKKSYLFFSENFTLKNIADPDKPFLKDVPLQPLLIGNKIVLKNVFFEIDSYALKKESRLELNKVIRMLQANPNVRIEIGGHTDNTGNIDYNQKLSENRAKSVADFLIFSSIKADRIVSKGYGMNVPVAENSTDEGKAQNRRTELKIIE